MLDSFLSFSPYYQTDKNTAGITQRCRIRRLPHLHWGSFLIQPGFSPQQANKSPCFSLCSAGLHPLHNRFKLFLCSKHYTNFHTQWKAVIVVPPPESSHDLPPLQGSHPRSGFPDQDPPSTTASSRFSKQVSFSHLPSHPLISYPFRQECSSLRKLGLTSLLPSGLLRCDAVIQACIS